MRTSRSSVQSFSHQLTPIQVESYAGRKADETPRRFLIGGRWMEVIEVIDRWYQMESQPEWPRADYFKVRATDGCDYLLKRDQEADKWFGAQVNRS